MLALLVRPFITPRTARLALARPVEFIAASLGRLRIELFTHREPRAFGSMSLAQIHLVQTITGGIVIIKMITPGIREAIPADIKLLQ